MIVLINPNLMLHRKDLFTTGIVYMPIGLAYFAGILRRHKFDVTVIDCFGEKPNQQRIEGDFLVRGLTIQEVVNRTLHAEPKAIIIYASNITYHSSLIHIVLNLRRCVKDVPVIIIENSQAVTAYSLRRIQEEFYDIGVDYIVTGEAEERGVALLKALRNGSDFNNIKLIHGIGCKQDGRVHYTPPQDEIADLDSLPFPAWDMFPLENYWHLKYAHGPFETDRYLPLLTSRGCPYSCRFCVIPETNARRWRARSAKNIVDEMEKWQKIYGVREFHIEDVNPTVNDDRTRKICEELIRRKLNVIWKISSGTKVETIRDETTIELMVKAGCRYISISPETGSPELLRKMNKPFNIDHGIRIVQKMNNVGIRSQACFVLGYPGESDDDRQKTKKLVHELTRAGVDEIAVFIITPVPGSALFDQFSGYSDFSELTFSPTWRQDYKELNKFRLELYRNFILWKLYHNPLKIIYQSVNFIIRRFETKMEMTPYRALHITLLKTGLTGQRIQDEH